MKTTLNSPIHEKTNKVLRDDMRKIEDAIQKLQDASEGWTEPTNLTSVKTYNADSTTVAELADFVGTMYQALVTAGILKE